MSIRGELRVFLLKERTPAQKILDAIPLPAIPEKFKGWTYWDCPGRVKVQMWEAFLDMLGAGNYAVLAESRYSSGDARGQLFISPAGVENMRLFMLSDLQP